MAHYRGSYRLFEEAYPLLRSLVADTKWSNIRILRSRKRVQTQSPVCSQSSSSNPISRSIPELHTERVCALRTHICACEDSSQRQPDSVFRTLTHHPASTALCPTSEYPVVSLVSSNRLQETV
ncbi:hypothetical protein M758_2G212400 [Ceratodon purpureus]|nr:hypothetical protein M758_2G212400 [Ceratodon purpureus]